MDRSVAELEMAEEVQNQSHEFPPKRNRSEETREVEDEDRISRLPDSLLVEILSRLPATKCAVRTGALSKRWKHIWTSVSKLIFTHHDDPNAGFNSFVDKTLSQRGQLKLKKLDICSTYNDRSESQVRNWVRYAINCNVQEINLTLWDPKSPQSFLLDQCFFINSFFTKVTVTFCDFNPVGAISWKNLLRLRLSHVDLDEDLIENILSGSPVLETLVLTECFGYTRLDITSKSVKKLVLNGFMGDDDVIEINAPNILTLKIEDDLCLRKLLLMNVSSLVKAELNYTKGGQFETTRKEAEEDMLKGLVLKLHHVKEFKIGIFCFKVLCRLVAKGFIFPSNLKVSNDRYDPFESDSDSDESKDSEVLLLDDDPEGDDELQE